MLKTLSFFFFFYISSALPSGQITFMSCLYKKKVLIDLNYIALDRNKKYIRRPKMCLVQISFWFWEVVFGFFVCFFVVVVTETTWYICCTAIPSQVLLIAGSLPRGPPFWFQIKTFRLDGTLHLNGLPVQQQLRVEEIRRDLGGVPGPLKLKTKNAACFFFLAAT